MPCNLATLAGLAKDCTPSMGGIQEVYIIPAADVVSTTKSSGKITGITIKSSGEFKKYEFKKNTGSLTSAYTIDANTGVQFVTSNLVMVFNRMETTKRVEVVALAMNEVCCLVKDCNGAWWYLGEDNPVTLSAGDGQTGTAKGDPNRYSVTLTDESKEMPYEVDKDTAEDIVS